MRQKHVKFLVLIFNIPDLWQFQINFVIVYNYR